MSQDADSCRFQIQLQLQYYQRGERSNTTVSETLAALKTQKGIEPKAGYTGTEDTDDFIFAVQTDSSSQTEESAWIVCADHVKEHSGALNATTTDEAFIRTGTVTSKTGTQRTFSINGNRCVGGMIFRTLPCRTRSSMAPAAM